MTKLLTFEIDKERNVLEIHLNKEGVNSLQEHLVFLKKNNENEHIHLLIPSWGGDTLTEEKQNLESELINHVKIMYWKD